MSSVLATNHSHGCVRNTIQISIGIQWKLNVAYRARDKKITARATLFSRLGFSGGDGTTGNPIRAIDANILCSLDDCEHANESGDQRNYLFSNLDNRTSKYCFWYPRSQRKEDSRVNLAFKYRICTINPLHSLLCWTLIADSRCSSLKYRVRTIYERGKTRQLTLHRHGSSSLPEHEKSSLSEYRAVR